MSVGKVSSVNNVGFKGNQVSSKDNNTTQPQNNVKDGKKKLALALGGLAVASVATFALYKTGKLNGIIDNLKKLKNKSNNTNIPTKEPSRNLNSNSVIQQISEFKNGGGKYKDGFAINADGTMYSGSLFHTTKDGSKYLIEYKDGKLISSIKTNKSGYIVGTKSYGYNEDALCTVKSNIDDVEKTLDIERDLYGKIAKTKLTTPDKTVTCVPNITPSDSYIYAHQRAEHNIYTTGLRDDMPSTKWRYGINYPDCSIVDVQDASGNHTITRRFKNKMKDVLKLNKTGSSGNISHYDENNNLISQIERKHLSSEQKSSLYDVECFGGDKYPGGSVWFEHKYSDVVYDANGNVIPTGPKSKFNEEKYIITPVEK